MTVAIQTVQTQIDLEEINYDETMLCHKFGWASNLQKQPFFMKVRIQRHKGGLLNERYLFIQREQNIFPNREELL